MPPPREALATARLQSFIKPTAAELGFLRSIPGRDYQAQAQETICPNDRQPGFFLLLAGWAANSIVAENGEERISAIHLPGDLLGMASFVMATPFDRTYALTAGDPALGARANSARDLRAVSPPRCDHHARGRRRNARARTSGHRCTRCPQRRALPHSCSGQVSA